MANCLTDPWLVLAYGAAAVLAMLGAGGLVWILARATREIDP